MITIDGNIYALYRLLDVLNILFTPDNPFRKELEKKTHDMLDDLEKEDDDEPIGLTD